MKRAGLRTSCAMAILASAAAVLATFAAPNASAQAVERARPGDATLDCGGIAQEVKALDPVIAAGDPANSTVARAAGGAAAGVGGQIAGSLLGGMFGGIGSVVAGQVGNVAARQAAESSIGPDAAAKQKALEAADRKDFLTRLATAKECRANEPTFAGKPVTAEELAALSATPAAGAPIKITPLTVASITPALAETPAPYASAGLLEGRFDVKGKRIYIAEFRVLYDIGGEVSASTRAGYLPGRDYGATSARVTYTVPQVDVAAFQAITDRAYADFLSRLAAADVKPEDASAFVQANGAVYEATESASSPAAPVTLERNGRKYLVMAPTGTKIHSRSIVGLGAGNMTKRMEWVRGNLEGISITLAVNVAALESSGSGSSILRRGSNADAKEGMSVGSGPDGFVMQTHANTQSVRMTRRVPVEGNFANFREVGGYDSSKDVVARTAAVLSHMGGVASSQRKRVDLEVDLDGPSTARYAMRGLATLNQALADTLKSGMQ